MLATLFGNEDGLEMYGGVIDADLSEVLQTLLHKYVCGDALQLYRNEVYGIDAFDWEPFPRRSSLPAIDAAATQSKIG